MVSVADLEKAKRLGEKYMTFELDDIMEKASIYGRELERLIEGNIKYLLEKVEGLRAPSVVIPANGLYWSCLDGGACSYTATFEVFDESGNEVLARGEAHGRMILDEASDEATLIDMIVSMPVEDVERLLKLTGRG